MPVALLCPRHFSFGGGIFQDSVEFSPDQNRGVAQRDFPAGINLFLQGGCFYSPRLDANNK
ncbi:MAG: hypothetical protein ABI164_06540, partial [Acidobacteriaceae bacterium]